MSPSVYVYVLKRQERLGRLKTRRLRSVQQVMDELAKLGIDPVAARPRLLDLDGVVSFRSPYYGLVTVEYPVEWELPARMKENPVARHNPPLRRNFFRSKPVVADWTVVLKDGKGSILAHADASDGDLADTIKRVGGLGHIHAVALASYARKGDHPKMRNDDDQMVEVYAIPRSNPTARRNPSREPTFIIYRDGVVVSRRPVDYTAMLDYLVFSAGMGRKAQSMLDALVSGRRESISFTMRRQKYEVVLAGKRGHGGASSALRANPFGMFGSSLPSGYFELSGRAAKSHKRSYQPYNTQLFTGSAEDTLHHLREYFDLSKKEAVAFINAVAASGGEWVEMGGLKDPKASVMMRLRSRA